MDQQTILMYKEFFQTSRDYIIYLQQIAILLVSAISFLFYKNKDKRNCAFIILISFSFLFSIINMILGLFLYSDLLRIILDFSSKVPDVTKIKTWIYAQFTLDIIILILLIGSIIVLRNSRVINNEK